MHADPSAWDLQIGVTKRGCRRGRDLRKAEDRGGAGVRTDVWPPLLISQRRSICGMRFRNPRPRSFTGRYRHGHRPLRPGHLYYCYYYAMTACRTQKAARKQTRDRPAAGFGQFGRPLAEPGTSLLCNCTVLRTEPLYNTLRYCDATAPSPHDPRSPARAAGSTTTRIGAQAPDPSSTHLLRTCLRHVSRASERDARCEMRCQLRLVLQYGVQQNERHTQIQCCVSASPPPHAHAHHKVAIVGLQTPSPLS